VTTVAGNVTTYTQAGVGRGLTLLYRIQATNIIGGSAWVVTPTTPTVTP